MIIEEQKYFGRLIFPEQDKTIESIWLTVKEDKVFAELPDPELGVDDWSIVWGEFNKLGKVSLIECGLSSRAWGIGGNARKLIVHKMVQGAHLETNRISFINKVDFESETINEWISHYEAIDKDITFDSLPKPATIFQYQSNELNIEINLAHRGSYSYDAISVKRVCVIKISFTNSVNIYDLYGLKRKLEQFILFITNVNPVLSIIGYNDTGKTIFGLNRTINANRFLHSIEINFDSAKDGFESALRFWLEEKKMEAIMELLLERKNNPDLSIPRYFLNLSTAIESYHAKFINPKERLANDPILVNKEKIKELIKSDIDLLDFFNKISTFWKKIDLIDRLMELKSLFQEIVGEVFPFSIEDLLEKIKKTRNKLAHDGSPLTEFSSEFELLLVAYVQEMLLRLLIIQKMGLEKNYEEFKLIAKDNIKSFADWNKYNPKAETIN